VGTDVRLHAATCVLVVVGGSARRHSSAQQRMVAFTFGLFYRNVFVFLHIHPCPIPESPCVGTDEPLPPLQTYWHSAVIFPLPAARCAFLLGSMAVRQIGLGGWLEVVTNRIIIHIENIRYGTPDYITAAIRSRSGAGSVLQGVGQESNVAAAQQPENGQLLGT
jgi:hypothetical protein